MEITRTVYYIHGPWRAKKNFCCQLWALHVVIKRPFFYIYNIYDRAIGEFLTLTPSLGVIPANIAINDISLKTRILWATFLMQNISVHLQPLLRNAPRKRQNSVNKCKISAKIQKVFQGWMVIPGTPVGWGSAPSSPSWIGKTQRWQPYWILDSDLIAVDSDLDSAVRNSDWADARHVRTLHFFERNQQFMC